jgi:hypothetical protein
MSFEGSSHLGPVEAIKRQNAELLQADVADLVLFLVGAYLSDILQHLHITLPPHIAHDIDKLGAVYDTIMGWATEAVEHAGAEQPHRPAGETAPVFDFERLIDLGSQDSQVQAALDSAERMVGDAVWQLATIRPDDQYAKESARRVLGRAISQLIAASARMMRLDAERASLQRTERVRIEAAPPVASESAPPSRFRRGLDKALEDLEAAGKATWRPAGSAAEVAHHVIHPQAPNDNRLRADARPQGATSRNPNRSTARAAGHGRTPPGADPTRRNRFGTR